MRLVRTEKAKNELASRDRVLSLRERGALFLADGHKTRDDLLSLLQGNDALVQKLVESGYLVVIDNVPAVAAPVEPNHSLPASGVASPTPAVSADNFDGKRSLATTRMFLFDICERMFARRSPLQAEHFRERLREARDRDGMLLVAIDILEQIEVVAGPERADGLRERIEMLLPQ